MGIIKKNNNSKPQISIILLDWSVREHYQSLHFLKEQDVPKERYELIWVELYDRIPDIVMEFADTVITCNQKGTYHKHKGYNAGLLKAKGEIICICDSDAVFPKDFVRSIIESFYTDMNSIAAPLVLMHYQKRTRTVYPGIGKIQLSNIENEFNWDVWANAGACMSIRKKDAITFGGFDEDKTFRGYYCGPYDLGWRLINAGIPEIWINDTKCVIWHFAHEMPVVPFSFFMPFKKTMELDGVEINGHAFSAVEAFVNGRVLPLKEDDAIHSLRLKMRDIGTEYEKVYTNPKLISYFWFKKIFGKYIRETWPVRYAFRLWFSNFSKKILGNERHAYWKAKRDKYFKGI